MQMDFKHKFLNPAQLVETETSTTYYSEFLVSFLSKCMELSETSDGDYCTNLIKS